MKKPSLGLKIESIKEVVWGTVFIVLLSIILANYWIGFYLTRISPLPLMPFLTYVMAAICGFAAYLFLKSVRKAFYASMAMCFLACIITAVTLSIPSYIGIVDMEVGFYLTLRVFILTFFYVFPFAIGGCFAAAFLFPD